MEGTERDKATRGGRKPGGYSSEVRKDRDENRKKNEYRSKTPITFHGCGETGHILWYCKKGRQGGNPGKKGKAATGLVFESNRQGAIISDASDGAGAQPSLTTAIIGIDRETFCR